MAVKNVTEEEKYNAASAASTTPNYTVDYNDPRFGQIQSGENQALTDLEKTYGGMVEDTETYYQAQIDATKQWEQQQAQLQQQRTDFAIEQIEQQKDQTTKDYKKEQSGAYVDWQKQSNKYGVNAEQMAGAGLADTGYSESSQVSMYNQYQSRVATARESCKIAIQNYNNKITEARLSNNAALAEIAYNSLQKQLELSLEGLQYKNQLLDTMYQRKTDINNTYSNRYQDVLDQINYENLAAEKEKAKIAGGNTGTVKVNNQPSGDDRGISTKNVTNNDRVYEVVTAYYRGDKNADCAKFGTFSNGYQPKGISGHGTLHQTGEKIEVRTQTLYGQSQLVVQNVWKAQDGTRWYWEGRQNKYIQL